MLTILNANNRSQVFLAEQHDKKSGSICDSKSRKCRSGDKRTSFSRRPGWQTQRQSRSSHASDALRAGLGTLTILLCICFEAMPSHALGLGEAVQIADTGVILSDGYGGPLPSSFQISQLGALINIGFNQEASMLGMVLQELGKKSLDTEALLQGIGRYFAGLELVLKDLQKNALTQEAGYANVRDDLFGKTPFTCSDQLTATAMREGKKSMRRYTNAMKTQRTARGEGTQHTELTAEISVAAQLLEIMRQHMTKGVADEQYVPSSTSMFPFSGVISPEGVKIFQAVISAVNSEPMPAISDSQSFNGKRALELQGIKMGLIAGIQEGLQISFDLQNAVINGQPFSEMQAEVNQDVHGEKMQTEDYIEGAYNDQSGAISILQALTHQFERSRIANPDWYSKLDHGGMTEQGLLREMIKLTAWRGYMETQTLRINMVNAYNLAQITAILMEKHDNARLINYVYPNGTSPARTD